MTDARWPTVVIGLGNPLMGDDGIGLAALEALRRDWTFEPHVELVDGGTWGMNLLHILEDARHALIVDAINVGAEPGTVVALPRHELPRWFALKISPHQIDFREVLALADLRGTLPTHIMAVGVQPETIAMTTALSPNVAARLPRLVERAVDTLRGWGHSALSRGAPVDA